MLSKIKATQTKILWGSVTVLGIIILFLVTLLINNRPPEEKKSPKKSITTGTSRINPQEIWVHKFTAEADLTHKRLEAIEGTLDKLLKTAATQPNGQVNATNSGTDVGTLRQELTGSLHNPGLKSNVLPSPPSQARAVQPGQVDLVAVHRTLQPGFDGPAVADVGRRLVAVGDDRQRHLVAAAPAGVHGFHDGLRGGEREALPEEPRDGAEHVQARQ